MTIYGVDEKKADDGTPVWDVVATAARGSRVLVRYVDEQAARHVAETLNEQAEYEQQGES